MAENKKISELDPRVALLLTDEFAIAPVDSEATEKGNLGQLIELLSENGSFNLDVSVGALAPVNTGGKNYDVYLRTNGAVYQKKNGVWLLRGTINTASGSNLILYFGDAVPVAATGLPCDIYVTSKGALYQKVNAEWVLRGQLKDFVDLSVSNSFSYKIAGGKSIRNQVDTDGSGMLHVNLFTEGIAFDEGTDIARYDLETQLVQFVWGLVVQSLKFTVLPENGDIDTDTMLVISPDGTVKKLPIPTVSNGLPAGGGTGQLLAKQSNDDYDVAWFNLTEFINDAILDGVMARKTVIDVTENFVINWQIDKPSGEDRTYAQKHGNSFIAQGFYVEAGTFKSYAPTISYTADGGGAINIATFADIFEGQIIII